MTSGNFRHRLPHCYTPPRVTSFINDPCHAHATMNFKTPLKYTFVKFKNLLLVNFRKNVKLRKEKIVSIWIISFEQIKVKRKKERKKNLNSFFVLCFFKFENFPFVWKLIQFLSYKLVIFFRCSSGNPGKTGIHSSNL